MTSFKLNDKNKSNQLNIKIDNIKETLNKTAKNLYINHWKNHIPVFGWCEMNYPTYLKPSLVTKYELQRERLVKELDNRLEREKIDMEFAQDKKNSNKKFIGKKNYRVNPDIINQDVMDEVENLVNADINPSEKFCIKHNNQQLYYRNIFKSLAENRAKILDNTNFPHNGINKDLLHSRMLYELGYKNTLAILTTNTFEKRKLNIDTKYHFDIKYSNIFPKSILLGEKESKTYSKPMKRIGDKSFEEENYETEGVKNLKRLSCDHLTDDVLKDFLCDEVKKLSLENHYWLSLDLISKVGRLAPKLVELNLRNLSINSSTLEYILSFAINIKHLDISECRFLDESGIISISNKLNLLKSLNCTGLINAVTDKSLPSLGEIKTLEDLNISRCSSLTSAGLKNFFSKTSQNQIKKLNLSSLRNLNSNIINEILKANSESLIELNLSLLIQKDIDKSVIGNISKCSNLQYLNISGSNFEDISDLRLLTHLESVNLSNIISVENELCLSLVHSKVKILRVSGCLNLTNSFLESLIKLDKVNLLLLEINRTPKIDDTWIEKSKEKHSPNLKIIRATNLIWNPDNIGLKIPLMPIKFEKPFFKGMKKPTKKKVNDKNPIALYDKFMKENQPKTVLDYIKG